MNSKFLLLIFLIPLTLSAAIESGEKLNVFEMKKKLISQNKMIQEMGREVSNVEASLGLQNQR